MGLSPLTCSSPECGGCSAVARGTSTPAGCEVHGPALFDSWQPRCVGPGQGGQQELTIAHGPVSPSSLCPCTGVLRVWEAASGQCVHTQQQLSGPGRELTHCTLVRAAGLLLSVTADHNLLLYEARSLQLQKQVSTAPAQFMACGHQPSIHKCPGLCLSTPKFAGYSEEILDVRFLGPEDSHIVVASNSPCLKVFELHTSACQILHGHTGEGTPPMPLDSLPGLNCFSFPLIGLSPLHPRHCVGPRCVPEGAAICQLCQGEVPRGVEAWVPIREAQPSTCPHPSHPQDQSIRVWRMNKAGEVTCVAHGSGHTHSVGTICCSRYRIRARVQGCHGGRGSGPTDGVLF